MSGPKSYSVKVFDKDLVHIFQLQCEVEDMLSNLKSYKEANKKNDTEITPFLLDIRKECSLALKPFSLGTTAHTIAGATKAGYDKRIQIKKDQLTRLVDKIKLKETNLEQNETIKNDYLSYRASFAACLEELMKFRENTRIYLQEINSQSEDIHLEEYLKQLQGKALELPEKPYTYTFNKERAIQELVLIEKQYRKEIDNIREAAEEMIFQIKMTTPLSSKEKTPNTQEKERITSIITLIKNKINQITPNKKQTDFSKELEQLQAETSQGGNLFLLQQLLRQINQYQNAQIPKKELNILYNRILTVTPHPTLTKEHQAVSKDMVQVIKNSDARDGEIQHILERGKNFLTLNRKRIQQSRIREKERAFIKQQLVQALEARKYEVVEDTTVIDFEKQSEFLLKVPKKENYVGVELKENDTLSYVFYSNIDKKELEKMSIEERAGKVKDMEHSCDDFYAIMQELNHLGISNKIRKPRKSKESYLQGLPDKYKNQVKREANIPLKKKRNDDKKKYLDD